MTEDHEMFPDWKLIDEISITLIEQNVGSFEVLQRSLASVVFCKVDLKDPNWTTERLQKMFRIAQLQLLYTLQSQHELEHKLSLEKEKYKKIYKENGFFRKNVMEDISTRDLFRCKECSKIFLHHSFLFDHMRRKHSASYDYEEDTNGLNVPHSSKALSTNSSNTSVWR